MSFFHNTLGRITWEHREIAVFTLGDSEEIFLAEDAVKSSKSFKQYYGIHPVSSQWRQGWTQEKHNQFKGKSNQREALMAEETRERLVVVPKLPPDCTIC